MTRAHPGATGERRKPLVVLDTAVGLQPLVDMIAFGDRPVAVPGSDGARLFRGGPTALTEFAALDEAPLPDSCSTEPRSTLEAAANSPASRPGPIAEQLLRAHRRRALTDLVVVAGNGTWPALDPALPSELRAVLRGTIEADSHSLPRSRSCTSSRPLLRVPSARERAAFTMRRTNRVRIDRDARPTGIGQTRDRRSDNGPPSPAPTHDHLPIGPMKSNPPLQEDTDGWSTGALGPVRVAQRATQSA